MTIIPLPIAFLGLPLFPLPRSNRRAMAAFGFPGIERHNSGSPARGRSENAIVTNEIEPWRGYQGSKLADKIQRFEQNTRGPVPPFMSEFIGHTPVRENGKTFPITGSLLS
jgi:hypothetical protein